MSQDTKPNTFHSVVTKAENNQEVTVTVSPAVVRLQRQQVGVLTSESPCSTCGTDAELQIGLHQSAVWSHWQQERDRK